MTKLRLLVALPCFTLLSFVGCSKYLTVEFLNKSGFEIQICSLGPSFEECKTAGIDEVVEHRVHEGQQFRITRNGEELLYRLHTAPLPAEYFSQYGDPILLTLDEDFALFLVGYDVPRDSLVKSGQPAGYPIRPQT